MIQCLITLSILKVVADLNAGGQLRNKDTGNYFSNKLRFLFIQVAPIRKILAIKNLE